MTKKKQIDWRVIVTGLVCLTALEIFALSRGVNGTILSIVIAVIGLAIGVTIPNPIKK